MILYAWYCTPLQYHDVVHEDEVEVAAAAQLLLHQPHCSVSVIGLLDVWRGKALLLVTQ